MAPVLLSASLCLAAPRPLPPAPRGPARIAVIGAGLSGASAARELAKRGFKPVLYEASSRAGGRLRSASDRRASGPLDAGGELVDSKHRFVIELARELGVPLKPLAARREAPVFLFDGAAFPLEEFSARLFAEAGPQLRAIERDIKRLEAGGPRAAAFDRLTVAGYLDRLRAPRSLRALTRAALAPEFGAEPEDLTALTLLESLRVDSRGRRLEFFPGHDESLRIAGGSERLARAALAASQAPVRYRHALSRLSSPDGRTFSLTFQTPRGPRRVEADGVVLALPPPALARVRIEAPGRTAALREELGARRFGASSKIMLFFSRPPGRGKSLAGSGYSDLGLAFWDGGAAAISALMPLRPKSEIPGIVRAFRKQLEGLHPGLDEKFLGWRAFRWTASFPGADRPGERSGRRAPEPPSGSLAIAGDAFASPSNQGFMNGAVEAGLAAARRLARRLKP